MNKILKLMGVMTLSLLLTNCASQYEIKTEKSKNLEEVPKWFVSDFSEVKACNTPRFGKKKDKMCIFGVGTAVSPDLQLAIEKGMMVAKSEMADIIKGEMNKKAKIFVTELGKTHHKTVVTDVETVLINIIESTPVRGYEVFAQEVTMTKNGYYRAWIGLRLPLGEFNKMYNYAVIDVVDAFELKKKAEEAYKLMESSLETDNGTNSD